MPCRDLIVLALLAAGAGGARAQEPLTLAAATARALAGSAEVRGAAADVRAAEARLAGASAPLASNPEVSGGAGARRGPAGRSLEFELALSQRLEVGGQRRVRIAAARASLAAARARLGATRARVAAELRDLFGRVAAARLRAAVAAEGQRLAAAAATASERRLQAGDAARIEVNSARIELGRATRAAVEAEQELAGAGAELELVLELEAGQASAVAFDLELERPAGGDAERPVDVLVQEAVATRSDLAAARLDVDAAVAEQSLASRAAVPAPAVGVSFAREERADVILGTLSFELPVFARAQAERGAASARVEQARIALAALERRAAQEVRLAAERLRAARRTLDAFDAPTLAALGENLALAARAHESGQLDLVRYQLLRREALEARRDRVDALEALHRAGAQLERALGRLAPAP